MLVYYSINLVKLKQIDLRQDYQDLYTQMEGVTDVVGQLGHKVNAVQLVVGHPSACEIVGEGLD